MVLPPGIDKQVQDRFDELINEAQEIIQLYKRKTTNKSGQIGNYKIIPVSESSIEIARMSAIVTKYISLIEILLGKSERSKELASQIQTILPRSTDRTVQTILGTLIGLKSDYEAGMLRTITEYVEAEIAGDYLGQAEQLLKSGQTGQFDHVPAAVLLGAILENALRTLCSRQAPPIPIKKPNGDYKMLNTLIDDLKKEQVFNELRAKQLRGFTDIRNAAAHGRFNDFNKSDVENMLRGVQTFLTEYL